MITDFFGKLFTSCNHEHSDDVLKDVSLVLTEEMNTTLDRPIDNAEIQAALFEMHPTKAPGPNGMHALFIQRHWDLIDADVCLFVKQWWTGRADLNEVCFGKQV